MKKIIVALIGAASLFLCGSLSAKTILVEGIAYETLSESTVVVVPIEGFKYYGKLVIPETITDDEVQYTVVAIGNSTFEKCYSLTEVVLPNTLVSIGKSAFSYCQNLKAITLPASLEEIGAYAFSFCTKLTKVTIPGKVVVIPDRCFDSCSAIASVTIGSSVTNIRGHAFNKCVALQSIKIPANVKSISDYAFNDCEKLATVTFANKDNVKFSQQAFVRTPWGNNNNSRGAAIKNDPRFKVKKSVTY